MDIALLLIERWVVESSDHRWRKAALIISRVVEASNDRLKPEDCVLAIERVINDGRLEVQGDTNDWRACELRIPNR